MFLPIWHFTQLFSDVEKIIASLSPLQESVTVMSRRLNTASTIHNGHKDPCKTEIGGKVFVERGWACAHAQQTTPLCLALQLMWERKACVIRSKCFDHCFCEAVGGFIPFLFVNIYLCVCLARVMYLWCIHTLLYMYICDCIDVCKYSTGSGVYVFMCLHCRSCVVIVHQSSSIIRH